MATPDNPLKWIRRRLFGVTQDEMAAIGGVSRPRISRYESGGENPPYPVMAKIRTEARTRGLPFSGDYFFETPDSDADAPVGTADEGGRP